MLSEEDRNRSRSSSKNNRWKKEILKRDNFTCQICSETTNILHVHHLENYSSCKDKRFLLTNGIAMCVNCHRQFHSKYGFVQNNKIQFEEFKSSYTVKYIKNKEIR
jgi:5-methylcytosine-specific restriction endonuclease McrA